MTCEADVHIGLVITAVVNMAADEDICRPLVSTNFCDRRTS